MGGAEAVIAVFNQGYAYVRLIDMVADSLGMRIGNFGIFHALQQTYGAGEGEGGAENKVLSRFFDQFQGNGDAAIRRSVFFIERAVAQ